MCHLLHHLRCLAPAAKPRAGKYLPNRRTIKALSSSGYGTGNKNQKDVGKVDIPGAQKVHLSFEAETKNSGATRGFPTKSNMCFSVHSREGGSGLDYLATRERGEKAEREQEKERGRERKEKKERKREREKEIKREREKERKRERKRERERERERER